MSRRLLLPHVGGSWMRLRRLLVRKVDMVSLDEADNRNRAFSALLISDARAVSLLVTWGRRDRQRRNARP